MRNRISRRPFWVVFLLLLAADQGTKWWVMNRLEGTLPIFSNFLYLTHTLNDGAAWNLLSGRRCVLITLGFLFLWGGYFFRHRLGINRLTSQLLLALIGGGILGNTIDRLRLGAVIDFIDLHLPFYRWPAFNLADSAICIGVLLYILSDWLRGS
jgi:signal peptidase II